MENAIIQLSKSVLQFPRNVNILFNKSYNLHNTINYSFAETRHIQISEVQVDGNR